jgi:putative nucleotidyltransferase with HDIG domain
MIVLLTDRQNESGFITRTLGLVGPCRVVPLHTSVKVARPVSLLVSNVSLEREVSVEMLRSALGRYRQSDAPLLCLLQSGSHRARVQAFAMGATAVLEESATPDLLVRAALDLLGASGTEATTNQPVRALAAQAGAAAAEMMDHASSGRPISDATLSTGADLVLQAVQEGSIHAWLDVVWNWDDATYRHSLLVAGLAGAFALKLGFRIGDRRRVTRAALLHDIGKARVSLSILNNSGMMTADEMAMLRNHTVMGHEILVRQGGFSDEQLAVVRHHHEHLDGSGYPDGLTTRKISDVVRLVTICDVYAGLTERRPTCDESLAEAALKVMEGMTGKLDMDMVEVFRGVVCPTSERRKPVRRMTG